MRFAALLIVGLLAVSPGAAAMRAAWDARAAEVLTGARKAIGGARLEALTTLAVEATVRRNINNTQLTSNVEISIELPDKYVRTEVPSGGMMAGAVSMGFKGGVPVRPPNATALPGGGMVIRMGPGGPVPGPEKLSPEEQERADRQIVQASRAEASRLMLGWFAAAHPSLGAEYTYAGEAEAPDGSADVIDVRNADGFSARLFVDRETRLPLMVTYRAAQPRMLTFRGPRGEAGARDAREMTAEERTKAREDAEKRLHDLRQESPPMVDMALYFEDWRAESGIRFPRTLRRAVGGTTNEEWTVEKVRINPRIDPKKFEG